MSDSENELALPADTLAALQAFRQEEQQRLEQFRKLEESAEHEYQTKKDIELFKEDWQLSQFWYDAKTANLIAEELLDGADDDTIILIVSAPSVYAAMTKLPEDKFPANAGLKNVYLFEFDTRFRVLAGESNFVHYDFNKPLENLPKHLLKKSHRVFVDPPFLSTDCQTKTAISVRAMLCDDEEKQQKTAFGVPKYRLVSCTGERMNKLIGKVYPGAKMTSFYPTHQRGLSNEFRCYATYEGKSWKFQDN